MEVDDNVVHYKISAEKDSDELCPGKTHYFLADSGEDAATVLEKILSQVEKVESADRAELC